MRKNVKKVIAPLLAAAMALSCTVCVSAAEDETIKLTVWGAEEDQNLLKELTDKFQEKYADQKFAVAGAGHCAFAVAPHSVGRERGQDAAQQDTHSQGRCEQSLFHGPLLLMVPVNL